MTQTSGFYDGEGVSYDRATLAAFFARINVNGYIPGYLNELAVYQHTAPDMSVNVPTGGASVDGYWYKNDAVVNLVIDAAHATLNRIDRIIVRSTPTGAPGSVVLAVLKGTAASSPAAPTLSAGEISLAQVLVNTGTTAVTTAMITDERGSDTVCGVARPAAVGKKAYTTVDMNSQQVTNLPAPSAATSAARLQDACPSGMIAMWHGSIATIPTGWVLCNGENSTPDLRDRFIVGAGTTYAVAATGGEATHTLITAELPAHTHAFPGMALGSGAKTLDVGHGSDGGAYPSSSTGSGTAHENRPPYYALAYIMKV